MKLAKIVFIVILALTISACVAAPAVANVVTLPDPLPALIGTGVLFVVGLLLRGRVPEQFLLGVAAAITVAVVEIFNLALGLVPLAFEPLANSALNLLIILLGIVKVVEVFARKQMTAAKLM